MLAEILQPRGPGEHESQAEEDHHGGPAAGGQCAGEKANVQSE